MIKNKKKNDVLITATTKPRLCQAISMIKKEIHDEVEVTLIEEWPCESHEQMIDRVKFHQEQRRIAVEKVEKERKLIEEMQRKMHERRVRERQN